MRARGGGRLLKADVGREGGFPSVLLATPFSNTNTNAGRAQTQNARQLLQQLRAQHRSVHASKRTALRAQPAPSFACAAHIASQAALARQRTALRPQHTRAPRTLAAALRTQHSTRSAMRTATLLLQHRNTRHTYEVRRSASAPVCGLSAVPRGGVLAPANIFALRYDQWKLK